MALPPLPAYDAFVRAAFGHAPFAWQTELAGRLHEDDPPPAITVPTGLGKSSIVEAWAWALAAQADRDPPERGVPLRLAVAINRRVVVDQIEQRARALHTALTREDAAPLQQVAARLRWLATGDPNRGEPLATVALRGGLVSVELGVTSPAQPTVISTTIHQLGSRLLFRGFSTSRGQLPIDAALVGTEMLLVVDEAHLHRPFLATLASLEQWWQARPRVRPSRFQRVQMTATPTPEVPADGAVRATETSVGGSDEQQDTEAAQEGRRRFEATKHLTLVGCDLNASAAKRRQQLAKVLAGAAEALLTPHSDSHLGEISVVGVIANTVDTARATHEQLAKAGRDSMLLTGRIRPLDRDQLVERLLPQVAAGRPRPADRDRPLIVVATQTIEVGADIDFDALATEAAAFDAMVQRLGRLDRRGQHQHSRAVIILDLDPGAEGHEPDAPGKAHRHPAYGAATDHTVAALAGRQFARADLDLAQLRLPSRPRAAQQTLAAAINEAENEPVALTVASLASLRHDLEATGHLEAVLSHSAAPARLLPDAHLARLTATSTARVPPDLPIEPFLVGIDQETDPVSVTWRADLAADTPDGWAELVEATPPRAGEALDVPLAAVRGWLEQTRRPPAVDDLDTTPMAATSPGSQPRPCLRHDGEQWQPVQPQQLRPGDTVVVPADYGGCDAYGWHPASTTPVADLGDLAALDSPQPRLRLQIAGGHADHLSDTARADLDNHLHHDRQAIAATFDADAVETPQQAVRRCLHRLHDGFAEATTPHARRYAALLDRLLAGTVRVEPIGDDPLRVVVSGQPTADAAISDDDATASSLADEPVTLAEHHRHTAAWAHHFADRLGLPRRLAAACTVAAARHDAGKHDARFQQQLRYANPHPDPGEALAKSTHRTRSERRAAARRAAWPPAGRHEQLSSHLLARWADTQPWAQLTLPDGEPIAVDELDWPLIIHLVAAHHGHSRPHFPAITDPAPTATVGDVFDTRIELPAGTLGSPDLHHAADFDELNQTYGPWTLALLETVVRLADHQASHHATPPAGQPAQPVTTSAGGASPASKPPTAQTLRTEPLELPGLRLDLCGLCWYAAVGLTRLLVADGYHAALAWRVDTPTAPPHPAIDLTADADGHTWKVADLCAWLEDHRHRDAENPVASWPDFPPSARNGEPLKDPAVFAELRSGALTDEHTGEEPETRRRQALLQAFVDASTHHTPQQGNIYRSNRNNRLAKLWTDLAHHSQGRLEDELVDGLRAEPIPTSSTQYFDAGALDALAMVSAARSATGSTAHRTRPVTTWLSLHAHPLLPVYNAHTTGTDHLDPTTGSSDGIWHRQPTWARSLTPHAIAALAAATITRLQNENGSPRAAHPDAVDRLHGHGLWAAPRRAGDQNRALIDRPRLIHPPRALQ